MTSSIIARTLGTTRSQGAVISSLWQASYGLPYSNADDVGVLTQLITIYCNILQVEAGAFPYFWGLDQNRCPRYQFNFKHCEYLIYQNKVNSNRADNYHEFAIQIAVAVIEYLKLRRERSLLQTENSDMIEKIYGEWADFALCNK